jgi:curli production assembly/transport component CsgG
MKDDPVVGKTLMKKEFDILKPPAGGPVTVAVYSFADKTGQRKPSSTTTNFSTAVTQGAEAYIIKSLQEVGHGTWFRVAERVGLDNLIKERQMVRQMREAYDGKEAKELPPMTLAGIIIEGGIIDYNTNTLTGGVGARYFGIGPNTQYQQDLVVVSLRAISVSTGEVLVSITVEKNLLSTGENVTAFKFFDAGTQAFEFDGGLTYNEPGNYAIRSAIELAVVELIKQGANKRIWNFKED